MDFPKNLDDGVSLSLPQVNAGSGELRFTYAVHNDSGHGIYLFNQLFHRRGAQGFEVDPNVVYAELDSSSTLRLTKQLVEVPEDLDVEAPEVPYVSLVAAGGTFSEDVTLPFPIAPHSPYHPQARTEKAQTVHFFTFCLGYLLADPSIPAAEVQLPGGTKHLRIDYTTALPHQRLKLAGPVHVTLQVAASA